MYDSKRCDSKDKKEDQRRHSHHSQDMFVSSLRSQQKKKPTERTF